jgi:hypothetical protein
LKIYIFFFLFIARVSFAQFEYTDIGAKAIALNGAFTSLANNSLAVFYNPSGLGQMKYRELSVFYSPAPFGLTELSTQSLTYAEPIKYGVLGVGIKNYGFDLYREFNFVISYANNFQNRLFFGLNVNYYNLSIKNYNSASSFGFDGGAMVYLNKYLRWGFLGRNITGSTIGVSEEKIAQVYRTGFDYQPLEELNLLFEIEKDVKYPISVRGGFEYSILENIDLRAGAGSEPTSFTGGIGFSYNIFQLDYAIYKSPDLGITHQGTISVNFGGIKGRKQMMKQLKKAFE